MTGYDHYMQRFLADQLREMKERQRRACAERMARVVVDLNVRSSVLCWNAERVGITPDEATIPVLRAIAIANKDTVWAQPSSETWIGISRMTSMFVGQFIHGGGE